METIPTHNLLRKAVLIIAVIGAIASLVFVFYAGQNNKSIILRLLFIGWVLSPFAALLAANVSKRAMNNRSMLYWLTIVAAVVLPVIYSGILSPPGAKLTSYFLFVPLIMWIAIAAFILVASKLR